VHGWNAAHRYAVFFVDDLVDAVKSELVNFQRPTAALFALTLWKDRSYADDV